jgi:hypothetical protein
MTSTEIELHQPQRSVVVASGSTGANLIREAAAVMADAHMLAKAVCNTAMVPKHFQGKPDDTAAAMLYGASLGLDPMQAVRAVYVVHGQPGLSARTMDALAKAAGHDVWTVASSDDSVTVAGQRKGSAHVEEITWTIERATKAGYVPTIDPDTGKYRLNKWGKLDGNEKYLTDPQAMLHAKATAEVCRKIAPDVLAGVYAVEELQSERYVVEQVETRPRGLAAALAPTDHQGDAVAPRPDASGVQAPTGDGGSVEREAGRTPSAAPPPSAPESPLLNTGSKLAKAMYAAIRDVGITKDETPGLYREVTGREVESSKELTDDEARAVLAHLDRLKVVAGTIVEAVCPECQQGKHQNCEGQAWDAETDGPVDCRCPDESHAS